jgi:hypothetical protein
MVSSIGHVRVEPGGAVDVDVVEAQALQAIGGRGLHGGGTRVIADPGAVRPALGAELDADDGGVAAALQGLADQHLVVAHAVEIAGVDEVDPGVERGVHGGQALGPVGGAVTARHPHGAQADGRDRRAGLSEGARLHLESPVRPDRRCGH